MDFYIWVGIVAIAIIGCVALKYLKKDKIAKEVIELLVEEFFDNRDSIASIIHDKLPKEIKDKLDEKDIKKVVEKTVEFVEDILVDTHIK